MRSGQWTMAAALWVLGGSLACACGARSGFDLPAAGGAGDVPGGGAAGGGAGMSAAGGTAAGGGGAGGATGGRGGTGGSGGILGGSGGVGGAVGGAGGVAGGCTSPPDCDACPDCLTSCFCQTSDPILCSDACGSGGGGSGGGGSGGGGSGGAGGTPPCNDPSCTDTNVLGFITLSACCTAEGACGLDTTPIASPARLPPGCLAKHQAGRADASCPTQLIDLVGISLGGCCLPSGACGNDFGLIELGCIDTSPHGGPPATPCMF